MVTIALMPSPIGQRVRALREHRQLLIKELAARARLKVSWVQAIETGSIESIRADRLAALAEALGVPVGYLITGTDTDGQPMTEEDAFFRSLSSAVKQRAARMLRAWQDDALDVQYPTEPAQNGTEEHPCEPSTGTEGQC